MQIYSPNMLKTFSDCEKKYEFRYIKKINVPQAVGVFDKGKKIHALAHYYLRGDNIEKFLPTLTSEEQILWNKLLNNEFFQKNYVNSEYNLTARVNDFWIGGRLDAFMKTDNNYFILDYKTGSVPNDPENDFQTMIYLICADKILTKGWGNNYSLNFVYINLKKNKNHLIEFDEGKKSVYETLITDTCKKITTAQIFDKNPNCCKFCEYNNLCNS